MSRQLLIKGVEEEIFASIEKIKNKITEMLIEEKLLCKEEFNKKQYKITQNDICLIALDLLVNNININEMIGDKIKERILGQKK